MSWSSLGEGDITSSSESDNFGESNDLNEKSCKFEENEEYKKNTKDEKRLLLRNSYSCIPVEKSSMPFIQEPSSDNDLDLNRRPHMESLLASKDEQIGRLQELLNCQREQLYHFLKLSVKKDMLLKFKDTCRDTDGLDQNESICMALDRFKHENDIPLEQTLLRDDITRSLARLERLIKHQEKLVKTMGFNPVDKMDEIMVGSNQISCYQYSTESTRIQRLLLGTQQILRTMESLRIQLKKLALVEEERLQLIERVHSMPADQRQYYAHLTAIEREKVQLRKDIEKLSENYTDLKQKCETLQQNEEDLNECIESKIAGFDLNKIKPGLEIHVQLMEMVERGELSLITMTRDEKGKFTNEFVKIHNDNAELSERLKDFDIVLQERTDLKRQIKALVESYLQLENEVKLLRLSSKTESLLEQLREACTEREQLKTQLNRIVKEGPGILRICGETASKVAEERDQLRLKLTEYITMEEDMQCLRFKASQAESYRVEAERLKIVVSELEEIKAAYMVLLDKNSHNPYTVSPLDRDMYRNMSKRSTRLNEVEAQREQLISERSRYKAALLKQEEEIKDLVVIADHLVKQAKDAKNNLIAIPMDGAPEGPEVSCILPVDAEKRLQAIRSRIYNVAHKPPQPALTVKLQDLPKLTDGKNVIISTLKSFLGFDNFTKNALT